MLLNSLFEASIMLILTPDKDTTLRGSYRPVSLISTDADFLNKILAN